MNVVSNRVKPEKEKMNAPADKITEKENQSFPTAKSQMHNDSESTIRFVDNRSAAIAQRKMQEMANNSPQVSQLRAFQEMANNNFTKPLAKRSNNSLAGGGTIQRVMFSKLSKDLQERINSRKKEFAAYLSPASTTTDLNKKLFEGLKGLQNEAEVQEKWDAFVATVPVAVDPVLRPDQKIFKDAGKAIPPDSTAANLYHECKDLTTAKLIAASGIEARSGGESYLNGKKYCCFAPTLGGTAALSGGSTVTFKVKNASMGNYNFLRWGAGGSPAGTEVRSFDNIAAADLEVLDGGAWVDTATFLANHP